MARRLNALLHEIEVRPAARMSTKEQLTKIFTLEIEAMHDEIEGLDRAARHAGTMRDPIHREADRQMGWAYRLLEAYGIGEKLSFETGSEGRDALLEAGVDPEDIPFIAATDIAEREGARRGPFLAGVLQRMAQVGLDDTVLCRDAATEEIHRAQADALLGSGARSRSIRLGARQEGRIPSCAWRIMPFRKPGLQFIGKPTYLRQRIPLRKMMSMRWVRPFLSIFIGRLNNERPEMTGDLTVHCGLYFLPMLYTYLANFICGSCCLALIGLIAGHSQLSVAA